MFKKYVRLQPTILVAAIAGLTEITPVPLTRSEYIVKIDGQVFHCYDHHKLIASGATADQLVMIQEGDCYFLALKDAIDSNYSEVVEPTEEVEHQHPEDLA